MMRPEVTAAMAEAAGQCVDMAELEAHASQVIADLTGAEAGYVASGAAACLLLATAACVTGLEPGRMARLPQTAGMKNEVIVVRSQRNFYDHAVRAAGVHLVEVGLPDRYAGAGVRDAEPWEIADAITDLTAAVFYVADRSARPSLPDVVKVAHAAGVPVIVDAAPQLPPQANLKRFIAEGADLVAFSGGKAINGPQATGAVRRGVDAEGRQAGGARSGDRAAEWRPVDPGRSDVVRSGDRELQSDVPATGRTRTDRRRSAAAHDMMRPPSTLTVWPVI
jgi:L-seryl-tRNA(Ser) seleniumtransferase